MLRSTERRGHPPERRGRRGHPHRLRAVKSGRDSPCATYTHARYLSLHKCHQTETPGRVKLRVRETKSQTDNEGSTIDTQVKTDYIFAV